MFLKSVDIFVSFYHFIFYFVFFNVFAIFLLDEPEAAAALADVTTEEDEAPIEDEYVYEDVPEEEDAENSQQQEDLSEAINEMDLEPLVEDEEVPEDDITEY